MMRHKEVLLVVLVALLALPCPALPCSLCFNIQQAATLRQDAAQSKVILYGTVANPRLTAGGGGITDFHIESEIRSHASLANKKVLELTRYLPVSDPKDPPHFLVFCDVINDKLDPYRGVPVKSTAAVAYVKGALALDPKDSAKALKYFFNYLDHPDKEIAQDAFLEFAKVNDKEIGAVAGQLSADKLRGWLKDSQTPAERLGLYAFLLGACGEERDAVLFRSLLNESGERTAAGFDGILGGYIQLRPQEGWDHALALLRDERKPFPIRFAVLRTLRFYHGWKPEQSRPKVLQGLETILSQGELADLAMEDLRRWQIWDLTSNVLSVFGKKGYEAPLMQRAIVRYALSCPKSAAVNFVATLRQRDPQLVKDVEESLQFEKQK